MLGRRGRNDDARPPALPMVDPHGPRALPLEAPKKSKPSDNGGYESARPANGGARSLHRDDARVCRRGTGGCRHAHRARSRARKGSAIRG